MDRKKNVLIGRKPNWTKPDKAQKKRFSEAASENKKKRGRPTVYKRDHMEGIGRDLEIFDGRTHRTHVNQYYRAAVFGILEEHKEIPYL